MNIPTCEVGNSRIIEEEKDWRVDVTSPWIIY